MIEIEIALESAQTKTATRGLPFFSMLEVAEIALNTFRCWSR